MSPIFPNPHKQEQILLVYILLPFINYLKQNISLKRTRALDPTAYMHNMLRHKQSASSHTQREREREREREGVFIKREFNRMGNWEDQNPTLLVSLGSLQLLSHFTGSKKKKKVATEPRAPNCKFHTLVLFLEK